MTRLVPVRVLQGGRETSAMVFAAMLREPRNGRATNYAEMLRTVPAIQKLEAVAMPESGEAWVMLEDAEWRELVDRLTDEGAQFLKNTSEALDMIVAVLQAQEVK